MSTIVEETKLAGESIVVRVDFSSRCRIGETPATAVCGMEVYSGEDADVGEMVVGAAVLEGSVISQRISGGVPGVIYTLTIAVRTIDNNIYMDQAKIVVLESPDLVPDDLG